MPKSKESEQKQAPSDANREKLLDAMLEVAAEQGWTQGALEAAAEKAGLSEGELELACPDGVSGLMEALADRSAKAAEDRMREPDI